MRELKNLPQSDNNMVKRYLSLYKKIVKTNISLILTYRTNFVSNIISSFLWGGLQLVSILLLTSQIKSINGWGRVDLLILAGTYSILWGLFHVFFTWNFERISDTIFYGQLDSILVKPADSQFLLSFWHVNFSGIVRIIMGIIFIAYLTIKYNLTFSIINIIGFMSLLIFALALVYALWYLVATLLIWSPRLSNLIDFLYFISGTFRYPPEMFKSGVGNVLLFMIPVLIIITTPTRLLIKKVIYGDILMTIFFTLVFILLSRFFWKFALRSYTSASG